MRNGVLEEDNEKNDDFFRIGNIKNREMFRSNCIHSLSNTTKPLTLEVLEDWIAFNSLEKKKTRRN